MAHRSHHAKKVFHSSATTWLKDNFNRFTSPSIASKSHRMKRTNFGRSGALLKAVEIMLFLPASPMRGAHRNTIEVSENDARKPLGAICFLWVFRRPASKR